MLYVSSWDRRGRSNFRKTARNKILVKSSKASERKHPIRWTVLLIILKSNDQEREWSRWSLGQGSTKSVRRTGPLSSWINSKQSLTREQGKGFQELGRVWSLIGAKEDDWSQTQTLIILRQAQPKSLQIFSLRPQGWHLFSLSTWSLKVTHTWVEMRMNFPSLTLLRCATLVSAKAKSQIGNSSCVRVPSAPSERPGSMQSVLDSPKVSTRSLWEFLL